MAKMEKDRTPLRVSKRGSRVKRPLGRPKRGWVDNVIIFGFPLFRSKG